MNHFISILDEQGKSFSILASLVIGIAAQKHNGGSVIALSNGNELFSRSAPDCVEKLVNNYYNELAKTTNS